MIQSMKSKHNFFGFQV